MKLPRDIRDLLKRKYESKRQQWLKESVSKIALDSWPLEINLGIPSEQDALRQPDAVRAWISTWQSWQGRGAVLWSERHWRTLGTQNVPEKLKLECPDDAAVWIGEAERWACAVERFKMLVQRWPALGETLPKYFDVLADYSDADFFSLCEIVSWLCANPHSNLYIRQVPVAGVHSKWLESRKGLVSALVDAIQTNLTEPRDFYKCCGLRPLPQLIRMRILGAELRKRFSGLGDISIPLEEAASLSIAPACAFIVENLQSALAFGDLQNAVVFMKLGYGLDVLEKIPWLQSTRCLYWGDIDTHGFAMLNRGRSHLPHLESVLMDEATLLHHQALWVEEAKQSTAIELPFLNASESALFRSLKNNTWGQKVRLEQERIRWDEAWSVLQPFC